MVRKQKQKETFLNERNFQKTNEMFSQTLFSKQMKKETFKKEEKKQNVTLQEFIFIPKSLILIFISDNKEINYNCKRWQYERGKS